MTMNGLKAKTQFRRYSPSICHFPGWELLYLLSCFLDLDFTINILVLAARISHKLLKFTAGPVMGDPSMLTELRAVCVPKTDALYSRRDLLKQNYADHSTGALTEGADSASANNKGQEGSSCKRHLAVRTN